MKALIVTEYQRYGYRCSCGTTTWAQLPPEGVDGFGPRFTASLAYLTGCHRISRRGNHEIAESMHGLPISPASVCGGLDEVGGAIRDTYDELACALPSLAFVNGDETSWPVAGKLSWLWIFVAPAFVVFRIGPRSSKTLKEVLGETFNGILCCDRFSAYIKAHLGVFQFCWAHLIRNIKNLADTCSKGDAATFSKWMLAEVKRLFDIWHRFRGGDITRSELIKLSIPIRARMVSCLKKYSASETAKVRKFARSLLKCEHGLFTFLYSDGVEPTNNSSERGVRPGVMWRRICQGNKTEKGARITERLLTITQTCRMQGIDPIEFLAEAILAPRPVIVTQGTSPHQASCLIPPEQMPWINVALGVFNLVPGYPLDGGRILRAAVWGKTGSVVKATKWASLLGKGFAWALMFLGILQVFSGSLIGGLWLLFIGMFLNGLAATGYQETMVKQSLEGVSVGDVMVEEVITVPPDLSLDEVAQRYFLKYGHGGFPVVEGGKPVGLICLGNIKDTPEEERHSTTAREAMISISPGIEIQPKDTLVAALTKMSQSGVGRLIVMRGDTMIGMITKNGLMRFLEIKQVLALQ